MVKVKNMDIEEAVRLYEELNERDEVVDLYNSRLMAEMDNRAIMNEAIEKATKKIERKFLRKTEELQAESKRIVQESEKKAEDNLVQIIQRLIKQNISKDVILKVTGISENKLKNILDTK